MSLIWLQFEITRNTDIGVGVRAFVGQVMGLIRLQFEIIRNKNREL